jgi:hypothetical protein
MLDAQDFAHPASFSGMRKEQPAHYDKLNAIGRRFHSVDAVLNHFFDALQKQRSRF